MAKVMLVGIDPKDSNRLKKIFTSVQVQCEVVPSYDSALDRIPADPPALVLTQNSDREEQFLGLSSVLSKNAPASPLIVILPKPSSKDALRLMRQGAHDCIAKPFGSFDVLATTKRAAFRKGRTLFTTKVTKKKFPWKKVSVAILFCWIVFGMTKWAKEGPPDDTISLGSANLSSIQWQGRKLWVADWYESTVTEYGINMGLTKKFRSLHTDGLFRMQDGQPMVICNTPDALVTIGSDLKMRSHQWSIGLPTLQTLTAPSTNPTGLAWDGQFLWSIDGQSNLLYKHGSDLRVIETVKSILSHPVGLAYNDKLMWVLGGSPLKLAAVDLSGKVPVWKGPFAVVNILPEGVAPTGMAIAFNRLWLVSGGDPRMLSKSLRQIMKTPAGWKVGRPKPEQVENNKQSTVKDSPVKNNKKKEEKK